MPIQQYVKGVLTPVLKAKSVAAMAKKESSPDDAIKDLAEAIAFGVASGFADPGLHAALSAVIVPPVGGPVGTMLSGAIMGQAVATPPTP